MLFWKDVGNRILLDRPLPFKLHHSYRPLPRFIREFNPASQEIWSGPTVPAGEPRKCRPLTEGVKLETLLLKSEHLVIIYSMPFQIFLNTKKYILKKFLELSL